MQEAAAPLLPWQPTVDLIVLRRPGDEEAYAATRASLVRQTYSGYQVHDATRETLTRTSLEGMGELVGLINAGDTLAAHALYTIASGGSVDADLYYSDEDALEDGSREQPFFKPRWSPDSLLSHDYTGGLTLFRRHLVQQAGGFRNLPGVEQHDLLLRVLQQVRKVQHVAEPLFQRSRAARAEDSEARRRAIADYVLRAWGTDYRVGSNGYIYYEPSPPPRVAVLVPLRDKVELLQGLLASLARFPSRASIELVIVDNGSVEPATLAYLDELRARPDTQVLRYPGSFNWSALNNFAVARSTAGYLLFLNNDIEALEPGWLDAMLAFASRPEIGAVGAQLLYPDGTLQHYGVIMGMTGYAGHLLAGCPPSAATLTGPTDMIRDCAAVTGACMLMRRPVFAEVGGFDENFIICGSDVAICLRALKHGYRNVVTPHAKLTHFESKTRGRDIPKSDFQNSFAVYEPYLRDGDPYYNPQLSLSNSKAELRHEPEDMLAFARKFI